MGVLQALMCFIWFIGWVFACGLSSGAQDIPKQKHYKLFYSLMATICMFFFWPLYVGLYLGRFLERKAKSLTKHVKQGGDG